MSIDTSGLQTPISADPQALRQWAFNLVNQLKKRATATDNASLNTLNELVDTYGTITNFGDLTSGEKALLGLSQLVADTLEIDDVLAAMEPFVNSPGALAVYAFLRAHQNESGIKVQQTVGEGLASQITTLTADLGDASAAIVAEQTARADGDSALATSIGTVSTTVAGHTTTLTEYGASIDGVEAQWGVVINAQGQIVGAIQLDASDSESTFTVVTDTFNVAKPDGTGTKAVFQVGTVGGSTVVALNGDMIVDGGIVAQNIAAGAIVAGKIAANAVTATEIDVSTLSALAADVGTLTAGTLSGTKININLTTGEFYIDA